MSNSTASHQNVWSSTSNVVAAQTIVNPVVTLPLANTNISANQSGCLLLLPAAAGTSTVTYTLPQASSTGPAVAGSTFSFQTTAAGATGATRFTISTAGAANIYGTAIEATGFVEYNGSSTLSFSGTGSSIGDRATFVSDGKNYSVLAYSCQTGNAGFPAGPFGP